MRAPFLFVAASLALALPSAASLDTEASSTDSGWVIVDYTAELTSERAALVAEFSGPGAIGIAFAGASTASGVLIWPGTSYEAHATPPGTTLYIGDADQNVSVRVGFSKPGEHRVLFWAAGDVLSWRWSFPDNPDGAMRLNATGESVYFWDGSAPADGVHAHAAVSGGGVSASDAVYAFAVKDRFHGMAGYYRDPANSLPVRGAPSTYEITLTHPGGETQECFCLIPAAPPGDYAVSTRGVAGYGFNLQPIVLAGADAPLL